MKEEKKKFQWNKDTFLIMVLVGILLFIIALPMDTQKATRIENTKKKEASIEEDSEVQADGLSAEMKYKKELETQLEEVLLYMEGVGKAKVMITIKSSSEKIVEKDSKSERSGTTQTDSQGMISSMNEMGNESITIYEEGENGGQNPYVVKEMLPNIEGVMVVAQGGGNLTVNKNITEAIQALFGVEVHKIKIVKMKS